MRTAPVAAICYVGIYPGRADQVSQVRRAVARHLAGCPAADDMTLIVSELASNAVVHSASRGQFFTVRAELDLGHAASLSICAGATISTLASSPARHAAATASLAPGLNRMLT